MSGAICFLCPPPGDSLLLFVAAVAGYVARAKFLDTTATRRSKFYKFMEEFSVQCGGGETDNPRNWRRFASIRSNLASGTTMARRRVHDRVLQQNHLHGGWRNARLFVIPRVPQRLPVQFVPTLVPGCIPTVIAGEGVGRSFSVGPALCP